MCFDKGGMQLRDFETLQEAEVLWESMGWFWTRVIAENRDGRWCEIKVYKPVASLIVGWLGIHYNDQPIDAMRANIAAGHIVEPYARFGIKVLVGEYRIET